MTKPICEMEKLKNNLRVLMRQPSACYFSETTFPCPVPSFFHFVPLSFPHRVHRLFHHFALEDFEGTQLLLEDRVDWVKDSQQ